MHDKRFNCTFFPRLKRSMLTHTHRSKRDQCRAAMSLLSSARRLDDVNLQSFGTTLRTSWPPRGAADLILNWVVARYYILALQEETESVLKLHSRVLYIGTVHNTILYNMMYSYKRSFGVFFLWYLFEHEWEII
jgi:hypothetical protein